MPTVCELKTKAKRMGHRGYSYLNKAELMNLVETTPKPRVKKERKARKKKG